MTKCQFQIVDVFAQEAYTGNPLAVVYPAGHLSDRQMQQIAKEMNYSETTFILSSEPRNGGYNVRIFTPGQELPFAGHPTLGTAYILHQMIQSSGTTPLDQVRLNLKVGQIPVSLHYDSQGVLEWLWMQQNPPSFHQTVLPETIAPILNLSVDDFEGRFPIQEVSTGVPFWIIPIKTLAALKQIRIDREKYFQFIESTLAKSLLVFSPEPYQDDQQLSVRMFADYLGIPEDPATGSANGCLAGYLAEHEYFGQPKIEIKVGQGYEIGRPSLLLLKSQKTSEGIEVLVGGKVIPIAQGELL